MNQDEKQAGLLVKYSSTTGPYPPSRGMDWRRAGAGLPEVMLNGQDLSHRSFLAGRDQEDKEEDSLAGRFALSRGLASLDGLMVQKERDGFKQEFKQLDMVMQIKKEENELAGFQEKKKRTQPPPAKALTMNENGLLGLQISRPYVCEHCSATFRTSYHLQRHAFIHTGEKPFQCSQCDMRFIQKYLLQRHEKIHTGEKPFRCDECGMKFIQRYHLERHRRTHSGEKPYQCCHCQQHFSRTDRVLKHQRMCRENRRTHQMNGKDDLAASEQDLAFSSHPQDYSQPKKKRHKPSEKPENLQKKSEKREGREELGGPIRRECLSLGSITPNVKNEFERTEYMMELPDVAVGGSCLAREPTSEINHTQKVILMKLASKKSQRKPTGPHDDMSPLSSFGDGKVSRYAFQLGDKPGFPGMESHANLDAMAVDAHQGVPNKLSASYDDAMQFLKKRRYLQPGVASSAWDYALNMAVATQASASQSTGSRIRSDVTTTCVSHSQTTKTEIQSVQDKNILSDEVLQTLIDHYSNKANGQPEVCFAVANTEVTSSISGSSSNVCADSHVKAMGMNVQAPRSGNASILQEYSKFLQQALERTSQNDSYLNTHSLPFVSKSQSLSNPPRFSAIGTHYTSPSRLPSGLIPSLRLSSKKSQFGLLVGDSQHSFFCSGEETNPSSISSTEDFLDQVTPPQKSDLPPPIGPAFRVGAFEQNFHPLFQSCGSGVSSLFSFSSGAVNLHGHERGTDFSEYPLASLADTRTRPTSSLDSTGSQSYH